MTLAQHGSSCTSCDLVLVVLISSSKNNVGFSVCTHLYRDQTLCLTTFMQTARLKAVCRSMRILQVYRVSPYPRGRVTVLFDNVARQLFWSRSRSTFGGHICPPSAVTSEEPLNMSRTRPTDHQWTLNPTSSADRNILGRGWAQL